MKKSILLLLLLGLFLMPLQAFAVGAGDEYASMNFEEVLEDEGIEPEYSSYKETDNQAVIYLFRGKGCSFCKKFIRFLNSITDEYGKYFKVVSYETWRDAKNAGLLKDVADFLDETAGGVPYIVIGDEVFVGYSEQYDEDIIEAIMDLYQSKDRYDVFEAMASAPDEDTVLASNTIIIWNFIFVAVGCASVMAFVQHKNNSLNRRFDELEKRIKNQVKGKKTKE